MVSERYEHMEMVSERYGHMEMVSERYGHMEMVSKKLITTSQQRSACVIWVYA